MLARWLGSPHVARFWNHETTPGAIERDFGGNVDDTEPSFDCIVEDVGVPVGFIQRSAIWDYADEQRELIALADVPRGALTIDYFIGEVGKAGMGVGTRMIQEFTELCFTDCPAASAIFVPVIAGNPASWKALEAAGYGSPKATSRPTTRSMTGGTSSITGLGSEKPISLCCANAIFQRIGGAVDFRGMRTGVALRIVLPSSSSNRSSTPASAI
ncbi:GNAT family N-acetyltransferase [Brevibacterium sp. VCM10]|uniref:GNAT family N-acetyltransferase n=1 Tax=Brevibacterium sp. VCM10 TaxID=1381751 RepID=UPI0018CC5EA6